MTNRTISSALSRVAHAPLPVMRRVAVFGLLVLAATLSAPPQSLANQCRSASDSYCFQADINNNLVGNSTYSVTNRCQGSLSVSVLTCEAVPGTTECATVSSGGANFRVNASTSNYDLSRGQTRTGTTIHAIESAKCCETDSDTVFFQSARYNICTISEAKYQAFADGAQVCQDAWDEAPASDYCGELDIGWSVIEGKHLCNIDANCSPARRGAEDNREPRKAFNYSTELTDYYSCLDDLQEGECSGNNWGVCGGDRYCDTGDCNWHFGRSPAAATCTDRTATVTGSAQCNLTATCEGQAETTMLTVGVWDADDVVNCGGVLTLDSC